VTPTVDFDRFKRALVIKLRHHGDVLLASPVFSVLKARAPSMEIDALVYDDTEEMLTLHPAIHSIHVVGRKWRQLSPFGRAAAEWELFRRLRAARYDLLVHLTDHPRGAWLARTLGARTSVAPRREGRWWRSSFTHLHPTVGGGRRHTVETHLDALRRIGLHPLPEARRLVLHPGVAAYAVVDALLAQHNLSAQPFIHLHPASRWRFKCWSEEGTAELIDRLHGDGHRVVVTAAPTDAERQLVERVIARCARAPVNLAGALSLKQLAALTDRARLFIGVDSAPMHIAAAMQTPTVVLFGPSGEIEWGPWCVPHRVVASSAHPCRPCGLDGCGGGKVSDCLVSIGSAAVYEAARGLLRETA
jgi:heptosyltransferase-3